MMESIKFDCSKWRKSERLLMKSDSRWERRIQPFLPVSFTIHEAKLGIFGQRATRLGSSGRGAYFLDRLQGVSPASVMDLGTGAGVFLRRNSRRERDDGLERATQTVTCVSFFDLLLFFYQEMNKRAGMMATPELKSLFLGWNWRAPAHVQWCHPFPHQVLAVRISAAWHF